MNPDGNTQLPPGWVQEASKSGAPTVSLNGKYLHSRFNPVSEAARLAETVPRSAAVVILAGLGLGYVAEELVRCSPERPLIIAEADPLLVQAAAGVRDLSALIGRKNVSLFIGGNPDGIRSYLKGGAAGSDIHLVRWRPSVESSPDWYERLALAVEESSRRRQVNAHTLERFGRLWVRNIVANSSLLSTALALKPLEDTFSGIPALILAGGPSLDGILPFLKSLRDSHLLIAVDTAVGAVLRAGVIPDIVAAVDPQYWNTRHLDRCGDALSQSLIIAEASTHPSVFRILGGRPVLSRSHFPLGTILEDAAGLDGELKAGGSVATAAWDFSRFLGCSRLCIAGLDLGFPGRITHYSGSLARERPHIYSERSTPAQTAFYHALHDAHPHAVKAMNGESLLSDQRMDIYAAWFSENASSLHPGSACVVGSSGRKLHGMQTVSIEELLMEPEKRKLIDKRLKRIRETPMDQNAGARVRETLKAIQPAMEQLLDLSEKATAICDNLLAARERGENISDGLRKLNDIDKRLLSGSGREIVSFLIQNVIRETLNDDSNGEQSLEKSRKLYAELAESARYHHYYLQPGKKNNQAYTELSR